MKLHKLNLVLLLVLAIGCSSLPSRPFTFTDAAKIRNGMTSAEVLQILGTPSAKYPQPDGSEFWQWQSGPNMFRIQLRDGLVAGVPDSVAGTGRGPEEFRRARELAEREDWIRHNKPSEPLAAKVRSGQLSLGMADEYLDHERELSKKKEREAERLAYLENPKRPLTPEIRDALTRHTVALGMTQEEVVLAYGPPDHINRTVHRAGAAESWIYEGRRQNLYLRFREGGLLESWDESRPWSKP